MSVAIAVLLVATIMSFSMFVFLYIKRKVVPDLMDSIVGLQLMAFLWSLGKTLELLAPNLSLQNYALIISHIAINFSGVIWLTFCLQYTDNAWIGQRPNRVLLISPMLIMYLLFLTNQYHYLYYSELGYRHFRSGPAFFLVILITCVYVFTGVFFLIRRIKKVDSYVKQQIRLILYALLIPFCVGLLGGINIIFFKDTLPNHHLTPCCFAITTFLAALAVFKYRFLNLVAVARKEIVDNLAEAILIVNNEDRIISYNHSFSANFSDYNPFETNGEVAGFINYLKSKTDNTRLLNCLNGRQCLKGKEIITWNNNQKSLAVNIRPFRYRTEQVGRIVSFTDITEYQTMLNELSNKNRQLEEYAAAVEELSVMKERNRFARDVHDTTGHTMTLLMALLEVSIINCEKDACGTKLKLQEALRLAKAGFTELRNSIYNLSVRQQESQNLLSPIKKLIADFRHTGMRIELFVEGEILSEVHASYFHVLYRVCQEALTNSLRHGKAELVAIMLCFSDADIKVYIFDNGCGCKEIKPGIGLSGMAQRIQEINGSIVYGSPQEAGGFNINIKIPIDRSAAKEAI